MISRGQREQDALLMTSFALKTSFAQRTSFAQKTSSFNPFSLCGIDNSCTLLELMVKLGQLRSLN